MAKELAWIAIIMSACIESSPSERNYCCKKNFEDKFLPYKKA